MNAYEEIPPPERNPALVVPFFAVQKVPGIIEEEIFHSWLKDDGIQTSLGTFRSSEPVVLAVGESQSECLHDKKVRRHTRQISISS